MKVSEQCGIAASKGNQILGLIRRNITYKGKKLIIPLYKAIVRPHLDPSSIYLVISSKKHNIFVNLFKIGKVLSLI